ncbi:MAG: response regulator transcription factor [Hellea sp.]
MAQTEPIDLQTAIIADDHAIVRQGTAQILASIEEVAVVAQTDNGLSAIAEVKKHQPNLLVLDAAMPMARGIEVYSEARRWSPDTRVILLTGFTSLSLLSDWLDAGVDGLLLKSCSPEEMREAFQVVLGGGNYIAKSVQEMLKTAIAPRGLTPREREILSLISTGHANSAIGKRLSISPKTVEKHRGSLMSKLGVHSVAELMVYALREGLLDEHKQL